MFLVCSKSEDDSLGWCDFSLPACGEQFENEDGSSRQAELARCQPGDWLDLVREPNNPHDPQAVAIFSERGIRVGYLRRQYASVWGSKIDRGMTIAAIVERVKGASLPGSPLGLVMRVNADGDEPELPDDQPCLGGWSNSVARAG